ncbi:MAG TPA: hypothetical protein VIX19_02215 [Terriglobales bacterium]
MTRVAGISPRRACLILAAALVLIWPGRGVFGWGREGHTVVALIAEHYMTAAALKDSSDLLTAPPSSPWRAGPTITGSPGDRAPSLYRHPAGGLENRHGARVSER